ncbi:MAG: UDP-N-acetylmuramate dehydrogenase [Candidatus Moraniibacteriota bacterium]
MLTIQKNIPLAPLTTFKIGGPAKFFCAAKNEGELLEALDFAKESKLEIFMLGGGSNILFSDKGFDGLVIKLQGSEGISQNVIKLNGELIECWVGESLASVVSFAKENNLVGMEWAVGIPGTVGGAVRGNAGAFGGQMADNIESVKVFDISSESLGVLEYKNADCEFFYRTSLFKKNPSLIVISVKLKMEKGENEAIESRMQEIIKVRTEHQPKGFSSGSFFQNPVTENQELIAGFEKDTGAKARDGVIPAGWLIEEAGFKGKKIGGVMVSEKHANFFINDGTGTAEDVVILAGIIKQKIREEFDTQIKEEIIYVGF